MRADTGPQSSRRWRPSSIKVSGWWFAASEFAWRRSRVRLRVTQGVLSLSAPSGGSHEISRLCYRWAALADYRHTGCKCVCVCERRLSCRLRGSARCGRCETPCCRLLLARRRKNLPIIDHDERHLNAVRGTVRRSDDLPLARPRCSPSPGSPRKWCAVIARFFTKGLSEAGAVWDYIDVASSVPSLTKQILTTSFPDCGPSFSLPSSRELRPIYPTAQTYLKP